MARGIRHFHVEVVQLMAKKCITTHDARAKVVLLIKGLFYGGGGDPR